MGQCHGEREFRVDLSPTPSTAETAGVYSQRDELNEGFADGKLPRGTWLDVEDAGILAKCCTAQAKDKAKLGRGLTGLD